MEAETGPGHSPNETQKLSVRLINCSNNLSRDMIDLHVFDILKSKLYVFQTHNTNNSDVFPKGVMKLVLSPLLGRWSV